MDQDDITQAMTVQTLLKILKTQSVELAEQKKQIQAIIEAQNLFRQNLDTLLEAFNRLSKAFEKALPRAGRGPEAN